MQTVRGLKSFITARGNSLATSLNCLPSGIGEDSAGAALRAYPNPATDVLFVELPPGANARDLSLSDALGRRVPIALNGAAIDLSSQRPGIYTVVLNTANGPRAARVQKL